MVLLARSQSLISTLVLMTVQGGCCVLTLNGHADICVTMVTERITLLLEFAAETLEG